MVTFEGIILYLDGKPDTSGDIFHPNTVVELKDSNIRVTLGFIEDESKVVGEAELYRDGDVIKYKMHLLESKISMEAAKMLKPCVGGMIKQKEGSSLLNVSVDAIALSMDNADTRIKSLGEDS